MRQIAFDVHGPYWTPAFIAQLGDVLAEFSDAFSKSSSDFRCCSSLPFKISIPRNSSPVMSRPYRINPPTAIKQVDTVLDTPRSGPHPTLHIAMGELVVIPKLSLIHI